MDRDSLCRSAEGQQRCFERATATSALTLEADIRLPRTNRRDGPKPTWTSADTRLVN